MQSNQQQKPLQQHNSITTNYDANLATLHNANEGLGQSANFATSSFNIGGA